VKGRGVGSNELEEGTNTSLEAPKMASQTSRAGSSVHGTHKM